MTQMLSQAAPDVDPAEAAFEILERLGAPLRVPRFAFIAGLKDEFSDAVMKEAVEAVPGPRAISDGGYAVTVDDEDTSRSMTLSVASRSPTAAFECACISRWSRILSPRAA